VTRRARDKKIKRLKPKKRRRKIPIHNQPRVAQFYRGNVDQCQNVANRSKVFSHLRMTGGWLHAAMDAPALPSERARIESSDAAGQSVCVTWMHAASVASTWRAETSPTGPRSVPIPWPTASRFASYAFTDKTEGRKAMGGGISNQGGGIFNDDATSGRGTEA